MACTICTKSFGFFNKEHGCPVCKFSFCSGCLKYRLVRDGKKLNVCLRCSKLTSVASEESPKRQPNAAAPHSPPNDDLMPTGSNIENPIIVGRPTEPVGEDLIRSKLDAQKATEDAAKVEQPSDNADIEKRLAALKGVEYKEYKDASQRFMAPDSRTEERKVLDLLGQFVEETKLVDAMEGKRTMQDEEIAKRLQALKEAPIDAGAAAGGMSGHSTQPDSGDSDEGLTDEELARKLAKRYAEEAMLEAKLNLESDLEEITAAPALNAEEELPWCTICNEDAVLRCRGCDNDLYCGPCYKEFHCDEDPQEHRTAPFKGGKGGKRA